MTEAPKPPQQHPNLPPVWRKEVEQLLKEVWGYDQFRTLNLYDNLDHSRHSTPVSQARIVERIIQAAEQALTATDAPTNILLTAPTGAGKSLLFQLPAIYLGRRYGLLTLVVAPLKALITDQVEALQEHGYNRVGYASSDLSPEEKQQAYRRVAEGQTDLFYLSPELLLAYDIRHFVGQRRLGLVVVDEAHTVTTWGREFRVDYWFLGRYLTHLKAQNQQPFPLLALTATAVYRPNGADDMVQPTIDSLQMNPCEVYVGNVRRPRIGFDIRQLNLTPDQTYDKAKQQTVSQRITDLLDSHKTLLYYPFAANIDLRMKSWVNPLQRNLVATYYGKKDRTQKAAIVQAFREGSKRLIVATKAFGMGIDIPDIDRVYHVAPPSSFVDYVQEIGRSARDANVHSLSLTDYHERDFYYMNRLHAASAITQDQLAMILDKLVEVHRMKGQPHVATVSLTDFEYTVKLPRTRSKVEYEAELGQLIKTALLWIEEDLNQKYQRPLFQVQPLGLLGQGYLQLKNAHLFAQTYRDYLTPVPATDDLYSADLPRLWEEQFPQMGYREFKQHLMNGTLTNANATETTTPGTATSTTAIGGHTTTRATTGHTTTGATAGTTAAAAGTARAVLVGQHDVLLHLDAPQIRARMDALFLSLKQLMTDRLRTAKGRFDESELRNVCQGHQLDLRSARRFIGSLLESRTEEGRSISYISCQKKKDANELTFTVTRGFDLILARYQKLFQQRITGHAGDRLRFYCTPFSDLNTLLNLLSMLGTISFSVEGGGSPAVSIHFLDPDTLAKLAHTHTYHNHILDRNEAVFQDQITLFKAFFSRSDLSDTQRWDFIEDYFTGTSVQQLVASLPPKA